MNITGHVLVGGRIDSHEDVNMSKSKWIFLGFFGIFRNTLHHFRNFIDFLDFLDFLWDLFGIFGIFLEFLRDFSGFSLEFIGILRVFSILLECSSGFCGIFKDFWHHFMAGYDSLTEKGWVNAYTKEPLKF